MATGGMDIEVDGRMTCSICFEPFRGREAKILPCFHTFCLSCLTGLVARAQTSVAAGQEEDDDGGSVTCPTCRRVVAVPAGGVSAFQTNFYIDTSSGEEDAQLALCSLCDGGQKAQFQCGQCQNDLCPQCRPIHDKMCQRPQVTALPDPSDASRSAQTATGQVKQQLKMVEDALKKLAEEERRLKQDRQAMEDSINIHFGTLLRHAADARDACFTSLREACDGLTERLHSHMTEVRQARDRLQQQLSSSRPVWASQLRMTPFLQMILDRDGDSVSLLQHQREEKASSMTDALQCFMGKVVTSTQSSGPAQEASGTVSRPGDGGTVSSAKADPKNWKDLHDKLEDLAARVSSLQSTNTLLSQQVTQLNDSNSKLWSEQSTLQREVRTLKEQNVKLTSEQAALQREVTSMRDKHALVHQDLAVLTAEKDKACADLSKLQKAVVSMETNIQSAQDSLQDNRKALTALETRLVTATTQIAFHARLSTDVTTNKEERTLICDEIGSNVGGGYDGGTGVFTAPLAGTYCFLATTGPRKTDVKICARLDIVVDSKMIGYVYSKGMNMSTGHTAVKMNAGQKVWLRTYDDRQYTFSAGWWTTFSGMLLQPDV